MPAIQNSLLTSISIFIDFIFDPVLLVFISLIISIYFYSIKKKRDGILFFLSVFASGILVETLKFIFSRERPLNSLIPEVGSALPSGHASVTLVFFGMLAYIFFRNKKFEEKIIAYILVGILVLFTGFTRIYLCLHWLTDVLCGFVVGGIVLLVGIWINERTSRAACEKPNHRSPVR